MAYSDDLLQQARQLAAIDPRRPRQASVRRAVSAAYYALFHEIVGRSVAAVLSTSDASGLVGARLRRVIDHRAVLKATKWFSAAPANAPAAVRLMRAARGEQQPSFDGTLTQVCLSFGVLYEERHRADYDLARPMSRDEATRLIDSAETAISALRALEPRGDTLIFLLGCLFGDALTRNP